jgi:hypothetical protein
MLASGIEHDTPALTFTAEIDSGRHKRTCQAAPAVPGPHVQPLKDRRAFVVTPNRNTTRRDVVDARDKRRVGFAVCAAEVLYVRLGTVSQLLWKTALVFNQKFEQSFERRCFSNVEHDRTGHELVTKRIRERRPR